MLYLFRVGCMNCVMLKEKSCIGVLWTLMKLLTEYQVKCWNVQ